MLFSIHNEYELAKHQRKGIIYSQIAIVVLLVEFLFGDYIQILHLIFHIMQNIANYNLFKTYRNIVKKKTSEAAFLKPVEVASINKDE